VKTVIKSKLTSMQCGACRHWKSISKVQNDPRGYCYKGASPESRGRYSLGCHNTILLSESLIDQDSYPHYIPVVSEADNNTQAADDTLPDKSQE